MNLPAAPTAGAGWVYPTPAHPIASSLPPAGWGAGPLGPVPPSYGAPRLRPPLPPQPPRPRRTGLVVGLVAGGVGLLATMVTAALLVIHLVTAPQTLTSANGIVTVQVPGSWDDLTSLDAGQPATYADEDEEWVVPDLEAADFADDAHLTAWVSDSADGAYTTVQKDLVATTCEQEGCLSRGTPTSVTVAGRPAVQQLLRHPATKDYGASTSLVVSLTHGGTVVSMVIWWDEYVDPDTAALLRSITLTR